MSHQSDIKLRDVKVQARLLGFLELNSEWLYQEQFERGSAWLELHYKEAETMRAALAACPLFWSWWKNDWRSRDADMSSRLVVCNTGVLTYTVAPLSEQQTGHTIFFHEPVEFRPFYLDLHDPKLMEVLVPPPVVAQALKAQKQAQKEAEKTLKTSF